MTLDLDTFLTALYTIVDALYQERYAHLKPNRPGRRPEVSDSEVLTLAVCARKWEIENSMHWALDMGFREDENRVRKENSAENLA